MPSILNLNHRPTYTSVAVQEIAGTRTPAKRSARLPERQRGGPAHESGSCSERATFYVTGTEHSVTSATASAWDPTPWHAVQRGAWEALKKAEAESR